MNASGPQPSEITVAFLLFHRGNLVTVDQPALSLRNPCRPDFVKNVFNGSGARFNGAAQGVASERAEADGPQLRSLTSQEWQALIVHHDHAVIATDDRTFVGKVKRHDRNSFQ